jgi:hypothetical protein
LRHLETVSQPAAARGRLLYVIDSVDKPGGAEQALAALAPHYGSAASGSTSHISSTDPAFRTTCGPAVLACSW